MSRRTIVDLNVRERANPYLGGNYITPEEVGIYLVTPKWEGCLTHLVRSIHVRKGDGAYTYHLQCGAQAYGWRNRVVDPADEMFGCSRCLEAAAKFDAPTFRLIPTSGCEVSGGRRWKLPARRSTR